MCQEAPTKGNDDPQEHEDAVATSVEKEDSDSFEDVHLDSPTTPTTAAAPSTQTTSTKEEAAMKQNQGYFSLWCGGRKGSPPITSGRDLGVWEKSLEDRANCLSTWLLEYLSPLLKLGSYKVLEAEDIGVVSDQDRAGRAYDLCMEKWQIQAEIAHAKNAKLKAAYQERLERCQTEKQRSKIVEPEYLDPSIAWSLVRAFGVMELSVGLFYYVISALLNFVPVFILNDLVKFFQSGQSASEYDGLAPPWLEVVGLGIIPFLVSLLQTRHQTIYAHCAVFVRTAVSTMIYRKALQVSAAGRAKTSTGQVVNLMSNDTAQLQRFLQFVGMTLVAPIQIALALYFIYQQVRSGCVILNRKWICVPNDISHHVYRNFQQVGNATWVGVGFMVFLAPINTIVFSIVSKQRRKVLQYSDLRVKMMNEILAGIRIIKFYAWERPFGKEVSTLRGKEVAALTKLAYTSAVGFSLILMSAPLIQPILVFLTYVAIQDKPLDAATAFTTVALFNIMRFPFAFMPMGLLQYIQSRIALRRVERYLDLPELSEYVESNPPPEPMAENATSCKEFGSVTVVNGSFSWVDPNAKPIRAVQEPSKKKKKKKKGKNGSDSASDADLRSSMHSNASSADSEATSKTAVPTITLQDLTFHIEAGSLVAVVGSVGSGKSSFLSALLGEMEPINGSKVYIPRPPDAAPGFVSYCSQTPWVVNDTLRGNVLFGREYDEDRYERVVEACALLDDLAVLPAADSTEIGERGINLSGGQKVRKDDCQSDIYRLIRLTFLFMTLNLKARVSLARALYSKDTKLMLMDDPLSAVDAHVGEHIFSRAINGELAKGITRVLVTHHVHLLSRCDSVIVLENGRIKHHGKYTDLVAQGVDFAGAIDVSRAKHGDEHIQNGAKEEDIKEPLVSVETKEKMKQSGKKLVKEEEREEGSVAGSAYFHYAKAGGYLVALSTFVVQGIGRGFELAGSFWLAHWAQRSLSAAESGEPLTPGETNFYVGIYALYGLLGVVGLTLRGVLIAVHRLHASTQLHDDLAERILRAPVAFFDVTPTGRILNRFAADMDKIDLELTQSLSQGISTIFNVLGSIAAMTAATKGTFLLPLIPLGYGYYKIQQWFRKTSTELQRLNSIANSPIFADFSQVLTGTSTVRAYGEEKRFFDHCKASFDTMNASYMLVQLCGNWLSLRLDLLGGLMGAFVGGVALATYNFDFISAGWLGLALTYSIEVTQYLKFGVRMVATIEAQMNSVERVLYYSQNVATEGDEFTDRDPKPGEWPTQGAIQISNASMRYRDGPLVLKNISLKIKPGEKGK
jgi:ATP-binding cassette subfamily C (CFTR/MRP) protein 1